MGFYACMRQRRQRQRPRRGNVKNFYRQVILITLVPLLVCPVTSLRVREEEDQDVIYGTKARIPPSVRRRLKSSRQNNNRPSQYHQDYVSPPPTSNYVEHKTDDLRPRVKTDVADIYPITITPSPFASHPKSVRASSIQVKTPTNNGEEDYTPKPLVKIKSGRRRKVKRPAKIKPLVSNAVEEDISTINLNNNNSNVKDKDKESNSTGGSGGDKNLAVEIGQEDGKYALIDKFFDAPLNQAPGVLSYAPRDDFAHDNQHTLGNLKENDIWLSDGHLLVLKGGDLDTSTKEHWKPIDNYQRDPGRPPLRIPVDTNNPPPFPVFVNSSGPPIFLGPPPPFGLPYPPPEVDGNGTFDPSRLPPPGLIPLYPNGSIPPEFLGPPGGGYGGGGFGPFGPLGGGGNNHSLPIFPPFPGGLPPPGGTRFNGTFPPHLPPFGFPPGFNGSLPPLPFIPYPPPGSKNGTFPHILPPPPGFNGNFNGSLPPPGFPLLPPLVLNPNDNETDDPSIFLPPPYDFDYEDGNFTLLPPGPFAPGLVVPPPKDFYTTYNKTKRYPSSSSNYPFGKRPQRPNGRKPKFPLTPPPDDSLEALLPQTTPQPLVTITPHSKKRKRPGKINKGLFGSTLPKFDSSQEIAGLPPGSVPISEQVISPLLTTAQPHISSPVVIKNSTPKPHNNYVYVRGQLKTLAEIAAEHAAQQQQGGEYDYNPTPRPLYDERGYPTRGLEDQNDHGHPSLIDYPKKTTKAPKTAYFNTPKYDNIYNVLPKRIKLKNRLNYQGGSNAVSPTVPQNPNPTIFPHHPQQQRPHHHSLFPGGEDPTGQLHGHGHQLQQQHQHHGGPTGVDVYEPNYADKINHVRQQQGPGPGDYYGNGGGIQSQQPIQRPKQIIQLQSPKDYSIGSQRQPHSYDQGGNIPQNNNPPNGFRPAFGPNQRNPGSQGGRLLFPGQVTQVGPIFNLQSPIFQQQKQSHRPQGYYSPITQYHQPIHPQQHNYYHQHQPGALNPTGLGQGVLGQNHQYLQQPQVYEGEHQYPHQHQQPQHQHYRNFGQGSLPSSPGNNGFSAQLSPYSPPQSQTGSLHQDPLLSYREPLPQYNTESEAVTSRAVLKAGPSQSTRQVGGGAGGGGSGGGGQGQEAGGDGSRAPQSEDPAKDVSFFTFQRGGPGGFSYKIRI